MMPKVWEQEHNGNKAWEGSKRQLSSEGPLLAITPKVAPKQCANKTTKGTLSYKMNAAQ